MGATSNLDTLDTAVSSPTSTDVTDAIVVKWQPSLKDRRKVLMVQTKYRVENGRGQNLI